MPVKTPVQSSDTSMGVSCFSVFPPRRVSFSVLLFLNCEFFRED